MFWFFCLGRSIEVEETAGAAASFCSVIAKSIIAQSVIAQSVIAQSVIAQSVIAQ